MIVLVAQADIVAGAINSCRRCPVSLAISRAIGMEFDVMTGTLQVDIYDIQLNRRSFRNCPTVHTFISDFDAGVSVKPFAFRLPWEKKVAI